MGNELKTCLHDYQRKPAWRAGEFAISGDEIAPPSTYTFELRTWPDQSSLPNTRTWKVSGTMRKGLVWGG